MISEATEVTVYIWLAQSKYKKKADKETRFILNEPLL